MAKLFSNNGSSQLAADIDDSVIQLDLTPGEGALFPATTAIDSNDFMVTVEDAAGNFEIMRCFERVTDRLTVERAQENTLAQSFLTGSRVEQRMTAGVLGNFVQASAGGLFDLGPTGIVVAGEYRGNTSLTTNSFKIPSDGSAPTIGGAKVIFEGDAGGGDLYGSSHYFIPTGVINMWSGTYGTIPTGWALCDGSSINGYITPDLSDLFVKGSGAELPGATGGSSDTGAGGDHDHGAATGAHILTEAEMPSHKHSGVPAATSTPQYQPGSSGFPLMTGTQDTEATGGDQGHTHTLGLSGTHTHPGSEPPYFVVAFIIKLPDTYTPT